MLLRGALMALCLLATTPIAAAQEHPSSDGEALADLRVAEGERDISAAWLIAPTTRYQHFVLGSDYEAGGLRVLLASGEVLTLMLDDQHVFEDRQPRLADVDGDGHDEIVLVLSSLTQGASLAVYGVAEDALVLEAKTPFIGRPSRWLNPAGLADFDGDGQIDIAFVAMPHLVKRLEVWTMAGTGLRQIATVDDVSNHRLGSQHIGMAATGDFDGNGIADLAVPDGARAVLRLIGLAGGNPSEIARLPLEGRSDGAIMAAPSAIGWTFRVPLEAGHTVRLAYPD